MEIPAGVLRGLIQRTAFAITAEDARYYLAGALLVLDKDAAAMVATDGHRLAWAQKKTALKVAEPTRVLVPRKAITELARLIEDMGGEEAVRLPAGRRAPRSSRPAGARSPRRWSRPSSRPTRRWSR